MSVEIEAEQKNKKKPPIKKRESFETLKKSLKEEISTSVDNLKKQDDKVVEIVKSVDLKDDILVREIAGEIHLAESLEKINSEAENLKNEVIGELAAEKSIWSGAESVEEKIKVIEDLFNNLNTEDLQREDIETHARGWNVTNNIQEIQSFKRYIIDSLSDGKSCLYGARCFKELINQKSFQDIIWLACNIDPGIFGGYRANIRLNAFIQERPEFLESNEFRRVCLEHIKNGIENGYIFEGYKHDRNFENKTFRDNKIDFFKEKDDSGFIKTEKSIFNKENETKTKRKEIPNEEVKEFIVNLDLYEFDPSRIDYLEEKEKDELKNIFLKKIKENTFWKYSSDRVFGDEIILVGKKLGFTEEYLNEQIFDSILKGILNTYPPQNGIDKEFPEVYKNIQETLLNSEKREDFLKVIYDNIRSKDKSFNSWEESFNYINLNKEELERAKGAYLDFSSGEILENKINCIFQYSWAKEEDFRFPREERLRAFETMNSNQRSHVIFKYSGSIKKINFLPFTKNDILEFAVNSIESPKYASIYDVENAQKLIQINFPNIIIDNKEISKRLAFKNYQSLYDIKIFLTNHSIEMSPKEILEQFNNPEDFVLKQIKGGSLHSLKALEDFKNNPETPELPYLQRELFNEIKQNILKKGFFSYNKSQLKELISFVPSRYKLDLLTDPDIQEVFSNCYADALKKNNQSFINDLRFLISKSENLYKAEQSVFDEYLQKQDCHNLIKYHEILFNNNRTSPVIKKIEELFKEKISNYGFDDTEIILNHYTLEKTLKDISSQKLNQLSPNNLQDDKKIKEWFNINYGTDSDKLFMVYNLIKNKKDFSYFNNEVKKILTHISVSEKLIGTLQKFNDENSENIDRAVEFVNDLINIFDDKFIEQNYDYLYQKLSKLNPEEYKKNIQLLEELKPFLPPSLVSKINFDNLFDVSFIKDIGRIFSIGFIEQNYDYLYQKLSKLNPEEYKKNIQLLEELRPFLSSPLISKEKFDNLFSEFSSYDEEGRKKFCNLVDATTYKITPEVDLGWAKNTILYVNEVEEYGILYRDQNKKDKMVELFSGDYKNTALHEMTAEWKDFLKSDTNILSPQIRLVSKIIDEAGGAGNMKYIESLGNLISQAQVALDNEKTTGNTVQEIKKMLATLEDRFSKEKWPQNDISEFYNLSRDILEAAPSLYVTLGPIFENIKSSKDMKKFMSDVFPFYQTQLIIKQDISGDNTTYNPRDLVEIRSSIKEFAGRIKQEQKDKSNLFESEKLRLLKIAKDGFKNRFGLLKVPDNFTKENLRSIQNTIRYMGNISERTTERESLIALYLGLELDSKWRDFRSGKEINYNEYISEEKLQIIKPLLEEKQKSYELVSEASGIAMDKMSQFQDLLQEDVSNNLIGSVQTIDVKLGNIKRNIDELIDPDIYQTQREKDILGIFSKEGKNVNAVLSKLYGVSVGKNIQLSEEDNKIKSKIESIFSVKEWTSNKVKEIQDEIQPIGLVTSMVNKMQEEKVEENITELQNRLIPNGQIIEIFNKLGEEFHQESGALALSKDLSYLENLIIKDENKITAEEKEIIKNYIESIREKMKDMENVFDHVKQYFEKIKKSSHTDNNPVLKSRITEIEKVIYSQDTSTVITSQMTKDLNLIIENMRQCLGCMRKEANNDTNLAFGDYNKFFMMNQSEKEKGSISDEIVFFIPITMPDGSREMSFVMDQVYGSKSADALLANITAVYKKYSALKKGFPDSKLSISVTSSAMTSVGLDSDILEKRLEEILNKKIKINTFKEINAFVPKSSLSDNYVEFGTGGGARSSGERKFSGLVLH
jgi:hypothetical protein